MNLSGGNSTTADNNGTKAIYSDDIAQAAADKFEPDAAGTALANAAAVEDAAKPKDTADESGKPSEDAGAADDVKAAEDAESAAGLKDSQHIPSDAKVRGEEEIEACDRFNLILNPMIPDIH